MKKEAFDKEVIELTAYYKQVGIAELLDYVISHKEGCATERCWVCMEHTVVLEEIRRRLEDSERK